MKLVDEEEGNSQQKLHALGLLCGVGDLFFFFSKAGFVLIFQVSVSYQQGNIKAIGNAIC